MNSVKSVAVTEIKDKSTQDDGETPVPPQVEEKSLSAFQRAAIAIGIACRLGRIDRETANRLARYLIGGSK